MGEEIIKTKKKENIMTVILVILIILFVAVVVLIVTNKNRTLVQEESPIIDKNTYVKIESIDTTDYLTIYETANLKKVSFVNIPSVLVSNFYDKQDEIINTLNNNIETNKDFIDKYNSDNNITDYAVNSKVDSIILYELKDNILSLLYLVEDSVDYIGLNNYITNIFIDVNNNSLVNNNTILAKYNLTKEIVCMEIFDNVVNYHDDKFIDKDTNEELTKEDIQNKKDEYVNLLVENFDKYIYLYFNEEYLYLKYNKNDISNLLFNENLSNIKYSTLKLDIKNR